jgi:hypothetical protein
MSIRSRLKGLKMKITSRSKRAGARAGTAMTSAKKAALAKAVKASALARKGKSKAVSKVKRTFGSAKSSVRRSTGRGTYSGRGATTEKKNSRAVGNYIRKMKK